MRAAPLHVRLAPLSQYQLRERLGEGASTAEQRTVLTLNFR